MNEQEQSLARCNLSCLFLEELSATSGQGRVKLAHQIAELCRGLTAAQIGEERRWARRMHKMDLSPRHLFGTDVDKNLLRATLTGSD